jgi:hypothetical protein
MSTPPNERLAERERFELVGEGDLAHGRRLHRRAAVVPDQFGHLGRSAAFEAHHVQAGKPSMHDPILCLGARTYRLRVSFTASRDVRPARLVDTVRLGGALRRANAWHGDCA